MKKYVFVISMAVLIGLLVAGHGAAQEAKKMKSESMMAEMKNSPHHWVMMAYRQNALTFAKALRDMSKSAQLEDAGLAREAFGEIKRGMESMDAVHQSHAGKMSPEMRDKMKPMMEKMQADRAAMSEHVLALGKALESATPDAREVEKHATALVSQLEKMTSDMKMSMPDKKKM